MHISLIAALTPNGVIGNHNTLPWYIPEELQYFKKMTLEKPIIMGRKTFGSMGNKALPKRHNIVLTHSDCVLNNCTVVHSVQEALAAAGNCEEVMVIGGAKIYEAFLPLASRLYLTFIHQEYSGDTYFPVINWNDWRLCSEQKTQDFTAKIFEKTP
jgi:dihydrofolate reductase